MSCVFNVVSFSHPPPPPPSGNKCEWTASACLCSCCTPGPSWTCSPLTSTSSRPRSSSASSVPVPVSVFKIYISINSEISWSPPQGRVDNPDYFFQLMWSQLLITIIQGSLKILVGVVPVKVALRSFYSWTPDASFTSNYVTLQSRKLYFNELTGGAGTSLTHGCSWCLLRATVGDQWEPGNDRVVDRYNVGLKQQEKIFIIYEIWQIQEPAGLKMY